MAVSSTSFGATGVGTALAVNAGESFGYKISGTFSGTVSLEVSTDLLSWVVMGLTKTAAATEVLPAQRGQGSVIYYRWRCTAYVSGTIVAALYNIIPGTQVKQFTASSGGKVGATSGWVVRAANNTDLTTLPASQTSSTLVIPIDGLNIGDTLVSVALVGQIESVGGAVALSADLRRQTTVSTDVTEASAGAMTAIAATAQRTMTLGNTETQLTQPSVVVDGDSYYVLITATTAAATDVALQSVLLRYVPAK